MSKKQIIYSAVFGVVAVLLLVGYALITVDVKAGYVGYVYDRTLKPTDPKVIQGTSVIDSAKTGVIYTNPFTQQVYKYPTTVVSRSWTKETETTDKDQAFIVGTKEGQNVTVDVYISVQPSDIGRIIKTWGGKDFENIVDNELYGLVKGKVSMVTQGYSVYDFQAKKSEMTSEISGLLAKDLEEKYGIKLMRFELGNTELPVEIQTKINEKASAINAVELAKLEAQKQEEVNKKDVAAQKATSEKELIQKQVSADAKAYELEVEAEAKRKAAELNLETAKLEKQAELEKQKSYTSEYFKDKQLDIEKEAIKSVNENLQIIVDDGSGSGLGQIPIINKYLEGIK